MLGGLYSHIMLLSLLLCFRLRLKCSVSCFVSRVLCLVSPMLCLLQIVVSRSDGQLAVWRMRPGSSTPVVEGDPWPAHKLRGGVPTEAWISFYRKGARYSDAEFVVSGGDEGMMKGWDLRSCGGSGASPAFVSKHHRAGVTAGQWHPHREHIFAR